MDLNARCDRELPVGSVITQIFRSNMAPVSFVRFGRICERHFHGDLSWML